MASWWNQQQNHAAGWTNHPLPPSSDPYSTTQTSESYSSHGYSSSTGNGTNSTNGYWNAYGSMPPLPVADSAQYVPTPPPPPPPPSIHSNVPEHSLQHNIAPSNYSYQPDRNTENAEDINVSAVLAERLKSQTVLLVNPLDENARATVAECDRKIKIWNERPVEPYDKSKYTGATPQDRYVQKWNNIMREKEQDIGEVSNRQKKKAIYGSEGWVRKDFFHNLPPVAPEFGLKMLKGMGWHHGQPIGKNKEGYVAPVPVNIHVGREGLHTAEEKMKFSMSASTRPKSLKRANPVAPIDGKHPITLLAEICVKKKIAPPKYELIFEYGNFQSKSVLMSVMVDGKVFEPSNPSPYKKHAKSEAARLAIQEIGIPEKKK